MRSPAGALRHAALPLALLLALCAPCRAAVPEALRFDVMDAAPFGYQTAAGPAGLYPAILAALSAEIGRPITVQVVPFARALHDVASGATDGTLAFASATTDQRAVALAPVFLTAQTLQPAPGRAIRSHADLHGLVIGRIRGGCQELEKSNDGSWRFQEINNHQQGIDMLVVRRIDALCSTPEALDQASARHDRARVLDREARWHLAYREVWLMVSPALAPEMHGPLRDAVLRLQRSGALARIFGGVLGPGYRLMLPGAAPARR